MALTTQTALTASLFTHQGYLRGYKKELYKGSNYRIVEVWDWFGASKPAFHVRRFKRAHCKVRLKTWRVPWQKVRTYRIFSNAQQVIDEPKVLAFPTLEKAKAAAERMGLQ